MRGGLVGRAGVAQRSGSEPMQHNFLGWIHFRHTFKGSSESSSRFSARATVGCPVTNLQPWQSSWLGTCNLSAFWTWSSLTLGDQLQPPKGKNLPFFFLGGGLRSEPLFCHRHGFGCVHQTMFCWWERHVARSPVGSPGQKEKHPTQSF